MFQVIFLLISILLVLELFLSRFFLTFLCITLSFLFLFFIVAIRLGFDLFAITLVVVFSGSLLVILYLNYVFLDINLFRGVSSTNNFLFLFLLLLSSFYSLYLYFNIEFDLVVFWYNYVKVFFFFKTKFTMLVHFLIYKVFFVESSFLNVIILVGLILILLVSQSVKVALRQLSVAFSIKRITSTKPSIKKVNKF